jgi:hypothetical protein
MHTIKERQTERQIDRQQTGRKTDIQRQKVIQTAGWQTDRLTYRQTSRHTAPIRQADNQRERQAERQIDRKTCRKKGIHTDRQREQTEMLHGFLTLL